MASIFILAILTAILLKLWFVRSSEIKGKVGETLVAATLATLPRDKYKVLNDIILQIGPHTSQIDHIVVSIYGVFVIETKNYKGWVYGSANNQYWTQNIWGNKYSIYNPIWQNESHIRSLKRVLSSYNCKYIPAIVFIRTSSLKIYGDANCVLWRNELKQYISNFTIPIMEFSICEQIADQISQLNIQDKTIRNQHKVNAQRAAHNSNIKFQMGLCPKCVGELIRKNGKYGAFYGCANYPQCRYTRNCLINN